jgi:hypothetical protein
MVFGVQAAAQRVTMALPVDIGAGVIATTGDDVGIGVGRPPPVICTHGAFGAAAHVGAT